MELWTLFFFEHDDALYQSQGQFYYTLQVMLEKKEKVYKKANIGIRVVRKIFGASSP